MLQERSRNGCRAGPAREHARRPVDAGGDVPEPCQQLARVGETDLAFARPGVAVGLSIWWAKMCPGGRNANAVTSQALTDMGGGATFYDALVDVTPA